MSGDPDLGGWKGWEKKVPVPLPPGKKKRCDVCRVPLGAPEHPWRFADGEFVCLDCLGE